MSLLPQDDIGYLDYVAEFFLAQKGTGLVLSPVDVELVRRWEGEGVPFEVVCRGIARAFEARRRNGKPRTPTLSLGACKRSIDAEVRRFRTSSLRGAEPPPPPDRIDRLLARARGAGSPPERAAYRAAYRALCEGTPPELPAGAAYLEALSSAERRAQLRGLFRALPRQAGEPPWRRRERLREAIARLAAERGRLDLS